MRARLASILLAMIAAPAVGQIQNPEKPQNLRPATRTMDCTSSGCHAQQQTHQYLHGPNAVGACDACHEYSDPAKHTFNMKRDGRQLCDFCHIDKTGTEGRVVHSPVAKGQCTACHNPHGADNPKMLKKFPVPNLCIDCHKETLSGSHIHRPAAEDCVKCHKAHTSDHDKLLIAEPRALCLGCHEEVGKSAASAKTPHKPATGDCLQCHTPHASNQIKALKQPPAELCGSCHKEVAQTALAAAHKHTAVTEGKACINCHLPHGSDRGKLLADDPVASCVACHKEPIKIDKDRMVAAVPELADPHLVRHGPIQKGECAGCHTVHGGQGDHLLIRPYARGFYQAFSEDAYSLCLGCHDKQLAMSQSATTQTGFRDGTRNLHFVHVAKNPQGRSCRACHTIHASKFAQQVGETVVYGQWKLPINYKPSETGGSCAPGCHKPAGYDRNRPMKLAPAPVGTPEQPPQGPASSGAGVSPASEPPRGGLPVSPPASSAGPK